MTIVVVDTSVSISALVFGGVPRAALTKALRFPYRLAVSSELEEELVVTLTRKFGWPSDRIAEARGRLWHDALWCAPAAIQASRDPNDDHVLGCAVAAGAAVLMTGDQDLLTLHPFRGVAIVTPVGFLAQKV